MNSGAIAQNGEPMQPPVAWHLGAIVGLTVIAVLVIWILTGLARYAEQTNNPAPRDTRSAETADYTPWRDSSISSIRSDILSQFPQYDDVLEEMPLQDEGGVASQNRFKIESLK